MISLAHGSGRVEGVVRLPASKSIANRLLLMRAVAGFDDLNIENLSDARDTRILNEILSSLSGGGTVDVHDAGTVMRFLTAYLATRPGEWTLTGTTRMQARPVGALVETLRTLGAEITYLSKEGFPPMLVSGKKLKGGRVCIDGSVSSQFISALLMIAPLFKETLELEIKNQTVSVPYIEMTLRLMKDWGAVYNWNGNIIRVENKKYERPAVPVLVESDWSAASYFYSIIALAGEGKLRLPGLFNQSLQGDRVCADIYSRLAVSTKFEHNAVILTKGGQPVEELEYDFIKCPDIAQTVAACCAGLGVKAKLSGLQTLTVKETDRIAALKAEIGKTGAAVDITATTLVIDPPRPIKGKLAFATYGDHRMAMSFAPLALLTPVDVEDPEVVEKSFPRFWTELKKLGFELKKM